MIAYERQLRVAKWTPHTPDQARALEIASKAARDLLEDMTIVDDGEYHTTRYLVPPCPGGTDAIVLLLTSYGRPVRTIIDALWRSPEKNAALVVAPDIIRTLESITELPITMTMGAEMADSPPQGWLRFWERKRWKEAAHLLPEPGRVLDGAYLTRKIAQRLREALGQKVESDGIVALSAVNAFATQAAWDVYHQTNAAAYE